MTRWLLAGGGTAGHVNPLLAVADTIRAQSPDDTVHVLGTAEGLEARLVPLRGYELLIIPKVPFPRRPDAAAVQFPVRLRAAVRATKQLMLDHGIESVIGFGGFAAAPAYLAAQSAGATLSLHEANARPGLANRLGARQASRVGVAFADTPLPGAVHVGMPLRPELVRLADPDVRAGVRRAAATHFGLDADRPVLLVTGGSQGALRLNQAVTATAQDITALGWQVIHLTGDRHTLPEGLPDGYVPLHYADRMDLALALADAAVSRSGAATTSELTALGIPAIYIPYPVGNGEQRLNAAGVVAAGGALLVDDAHFDAAWIRANVLPLLSDRARLDRMSSQASALGVLDGSERMLELARTALPRRRRSGGSAQ